MSSTIRPDFRPQRMPGENFAAYRKRRATVNRAVRVYLRGRMAHVSTQPVVLPLLGVDAAIDEQILQGKLRDVKLVTPQGALLPPFGPKAARPPAPQFRVGRTKGVTYRKYPAGRERREWRRMHRDNSQPRAE